MRTLTLLLHRNQTLQALLIIAISILIALMYATDRVNQVVMLGGVLLFVLLVWDLRIIVPLQIVLVPMGPRYEMWFGNLYVATPVMIIACVAWILRNFLKTTRFSFPRNPVLPALVVFLMVLALSAIQDLSALLYDMPMFLRFIQFFFYSSLFMMVLQMDMSRKLIKGMLILSITVGIAEGAIGVGQWISNPGYYVYGTFVGHHSSFALYIVFICMLLLGVLLETGRPAVAIGVLAGLGVLLVSFVLSFSRTGYISIIAGAITFLGLPVRRSRKLGLLLGVAAILLISYSMIAEDIRIRAGSIISNLSGRDIGISLRLRLSMWEDVFRDFSTYPILGRGAWTYSTTDNFFLKILGEAGLIGLAAFLWLLSSIMRQEWKAIRAGVDDTFIRGIAVGLLPATIACLIVFNLAGDMFGVHRFMGSFWIVLALAQKYCLGAAAAGVGDA